MKSRTLENLILENEDYFFTGNLIINGNINISNSNVIVAGHLTILGDVISKDSNLIVSGTLSFSNEDGSANIFITGSDISAYELKSSSSITIRDGDLYVCYLDLDNIYSTAVNIDSDGNIEVTKDSYVGNISCLNYFVSGHNCSNTITAMQDVYILGTNNSDDIKARDVLIGGSCTFSYGGLISKTFECGGDVECCSYMSVG